MKKLKLYIAILIAAIAVVLVYRYYLNNKVKATPLYITAFVSRGSISHVVTATGTVEPVKQVSVGTQVSGVIKRIYVDFNSAVKKGQLLAEIDKTPLLASLSSMQAELESASSSLVFQESNYKRIKELYEKQAVSKTDYENALYQYSLAKANMAKMTSEVNKATTNLDYAMIYSPIDGVILNRAVDEGQTVAASFNTPTLFTIAQDLTKMQVVANVDEADIGKVSEGQAVTFTVDAYPDDNFKGNVKQVRLLAVTTSNVVTYSVVIDAPNPELKLKPGLTASITIITSELNDVITIPSKALRFRPDSSLVHSPAPTGSQAVKQQVPPSDAKIVWIKKGENIIPVNVITGVSDETKTAIISGLNEGDEVILSIENSAIKPQASQSASSPFMPKRPGSQTSKK
jgi:HlyD family secretion protein